MMYQKEPSMLRGGTMILNRAISQTNLVPVLQNSLKVCID